jgi:hypothetical protein
LFVLFESKINGQIKLRGQPFPDAQEIQLGWNPANTSPAENRTLLYA